MKMPEQSPPVQRAASLAGACQFRTLLGMTGPGAFVPPKGVAPSQGPATCYGLQGAAREMCLSMFQ
jgi:hypothetical protein